MTHRYTFNKFQIGDLVRINNLYRRAIGRVVDVNNRLGNYFDPIYSVEIIEDGRTGRESLVGAGNYHRTGDQLTALTPLEGLAQAADD